MFCCGLCSYQSCGKGHLAVHACMMHNVKPVPWYTHCDESSAISLEPKDEYKNLIVVKRYVCVTSAGCQFRCLTDGALWRHMQEIHRDCSAYVCHLCFVSAETRHLLLDHYRSIHDYHSVQCLYCDFGAHDNWLVMGHIMDEHPNRPFKMLIREGSSINVLQELRHLAANHLTKCAVPPVPLPAQDSPQLLPIPTVQTEQQDGIIPAPPPCRSVPSQDQTCPTGHDEPMCDVSEQSPTTCDPSEESLAENCATNSGVSLPDCGTNKPVILGTERGLQTSSSTCAHVSSAVEPSSLEPPPPVCNAETSGLTDSNCFVCNVHSCGMPFEDILDFMNHLAECHPLESSFVCPKCELFVTSYADLLAHLVNTHSGVLFCPYKDCTFGSLHQSGVDSHIILVHQVYQQDQSNADSSPARVDTQNESHIWSESLCTSLTVGCSERLDVTPAAEVCQYDEVRVDHVQCEGSTENNTMDDLKITLYFCGKCRLYFSTVARYMQHMTAAHMVEFFCGYCLKTYKKSRCLLMHIGCQHSGQMLSVKCLKDGNVVDVGPQVLPLWIEEARRYLQRGQCGTRGLRGKSMVRNLKKTIAFMASVCSDPEIEPPEHPTRSKVAGHPRQAHATLLLSTLCTAHKTGSRPVKGQATDHSFQGQPWSSRTPAERDLIEEHLSGRPSPCRDPAADSEVKLHPDGTGKSSLSSRPPFTVGLPRRFNLKVHASAYVDPQYCKKVDGKIVVDEVVWQKLLMLNAANWPIGKGSLQEGSDSLQSGTTEGSHLCFECSVPFASFETLTKHVVRHHKDRVNKLGCVGTFLGAESKWPTQVLAVNDGSKDVKPFATTASWLNGSVQAESSRSGPSFKQVRIKTRECSSDDEKLFVRLVASNVRVPYSQLARFMDVNPVVQLSKLPAIKREPV